MSIQWLIVTGLAVGVLGLIMLHGTGLARGSLAERRTLRQPGDDVVKVRVRGIKATAMLVVNDDMGRCYRVASKRRGGVVRITYCPPSKRLLRLHVERLAERNPPS